MILAQISPFRSSRLYRKSEKHVGITTISTNEEIIATIG